MNKIYTGIGSRETPPDILTIMTQSAQRLGVMGWTLRSGCAPGADTAFEQGAKGYSTELYLPWRNFEGRKDHQVKLTEPSIDALRLAAVYHPNWANCSQGAQKLHARNVHQVYGPDILNPQFSNFVACWTVGGSGKGGTGQALRIARGHNVPIYDLGWPTGLQAFSEFLATATVAYVETLKIKAP